MCEIGGGVCFCTWGKMGRCYSAVGGGKAWASGSGNRFIKITKDKRLVARGVWRFGGYET